MLHAELKLNCIYFVLGNGDIKNKDLFVKQNSANIQEIHRKNCHSTEQFQTSFHYKLTKQFWD